MLTNEITKTCSKCKIVKTLDAFNKRLNYSYGVSCRCKICDKITNKISYYKKIESYRQKHREYSKEHKAENTKYAGEYYRKNREKMQAFNRAHYRKHKERFEKARIKYEYGLTVEQHNKLLSLQGGACAICLLVPKKKLYIDHNHKTGQVRALLCNKCNTAIGFFDEDNTRLLSAIAYLKKYAV